VKGIELEEKPKEEIKEGLEEELEEDGILNLLLTSTKLLFYLICKGGDKLLLSFFLF
jgi:hypothetical protein